jgi:hypothetical protein
MKGSLFLILSSSPSVNKSCPRDVHHENSDSREAFGHLPYLAFNLPRILCGFWFLMDSNRVVLHGMPEF